MKIKIKNRRRIIKWLTIIAVIWVFAYIQNNTLTVSEYTYKSEKIGKGLDGFRIVQISDLHNKSFGINHRRLIKKIAELEPDIIVLTGDLVDAYHTNLKAALTFTEEALKIAPIYYVTGNHEEWLSDDDYDELMEKLEEMGAVWLFEEKYYIEKGGSGFVLTGVDDIHLPCFSQVCLELLADELNVVLAHEPQYIEDYSDFGNVDLVLSGHAHGGQFILPYYGPFISPELEFFPEYTEGEHYVGETEMIISRGLGNSVIPIRLFNYPEIVCIEFETY